MQAPTYKEFRTWAWVDAYTPETLAPYVQADKGVRQSFATHAATGGWDLARPKRKRRHGWSDDGRYGGLSV